MTITVTNQRPTVLDPVHTIDPKGDFDPMSAVQTTLVDPLLQPLASGTTVQVVDGNNHDLTGQIPGLLGQCLGDDIDVPAEKQVKELLGQTLLHYDPTTVLPVQELFAAQAGRANKMHDPRPGKVLYTVRDDVIPAAKGLLAGTEDPGVFFASLAYTQKPNTLGFWFASSNAYDEFLAWVSRQMPLMNGYLPQATQDKLTDFLRHDLRNPTESFLLRRHDLEGNEEHSFPRVLIALLMDYLTQQQTTAQGSGSRLDVGVLPFTVGELFCPRSVVMVNVEAHARSSSATINNEWRMISQAIASPIKVLSHRKVSQLTALPRAAAKVAANAVSAQGRKQDLRSARVVFRKKAPTTLDLTNDVADRLRRMGRVNRSQNVLRTSRSSYLRANRRNPDDVNKPGRITSIQYMPDLHVYVDTSGSISQENYQDAVMLLIKVAKKLDVNLYFNSFSHILSQETLLRTSNRSVAQVWKQFQHVPKVDGGTDFAQIWQHINASRVRQRRFNLMITDFEWAPPSVRVEHPANLFYAPCSDMNWSRIVGEASDYVESMQHIAPDIRHRLLGMTA